MGVLTQVTRGQSTAVSSTAESAWRTLDSISIDRSEVPQRLLDLDSDRQRNAFSYKGQFSPDLVGTLLDRFGRRSDVVFDPFGGCGTVLLESGKRGLEASCVEINPAGAEMARCATLLAMPLVERRRICKEALDWGRSLSGEGISAFGPAARATAARKPQTLAALGEAVRHAELDFEPRQLLVAALMALAQKEEDFARAYLRSLQRHVDAALAWPHVPVFLSAFHADARQTPLPDGRVSLVITSPPYINVFNYHQHHRDALEALGWDVLGFARSEIGSNRKHRQNRILTVVQYCLDLGQVFVELRRITRPDARVIFVIGRVSTVRGLKFQNGQIIAAVAKLLGFDLQLRQERKFINNYGETIFEDILHLKKAHGTDTASADPREIGVLAIRDAARDAVDSDVLEDLRSALESASQVMPSPLLEAPV